MKTYQVDKNGYYGEFGGAYVPEILHQCVENLQNTYLQVLESDSFKEEFDQLLRDYVGRPSPLYLAKRLSEKYGCKIYLKREDLNHRRDGCRTAWSGYGYGMCLDEYGMYRLYGEDRRGTPTCQRTEDGDAGSYRRARDLGKHDLERRHERGDP